MKIAIISDIHGNMEALDSVLDNIKTENCKQIFCLGDIAMAGPEPQKALHRIQELSKLRGFHIIQGNTDKMLSVFSFDTYNKLLKLNEVMAEAYLADSKILNEDNKNFLKNLPEQEETELFGIKILLVHGSPRKNDENIYPDMKIEEVEEMIKDTNADVIFCAHTHLPCGYQTNTNQTVVNAGSVGRPFSEVPKACYAVMEIDETSHAFTIKHKAVEYDVNSASRKMKERKFKGADKLAAMLLKATSRYPK